MESHRKDRVEHGADLRRDFAIAADQPDTFAAPHLLAGARDRRLEKPQPARLEAARERSDAIGIAGRGAHHDLAGAASAGVLAERREDRPFHHLFHLVGVEHREDDRIGRAGDVADRRRGAAAQRDEAFGLCRIDVVAHHIEARGDEAARQHASHQTQTDDANRIAHAAFLKYAPRAMTRRPSACQTMPARHRRLDKPTSVEGRSRI